MVPTTKVRRFKLSRGRQGGLRIKCSFCVALLKPKFRDAHEAACIKNPQRAAV